MDALSQHLQMMHNRHNIYDVHFTLLLMALTRQYELGTWYSSQAMYAQPPSTASAVGGKSADRKNEGRSILSTLSPVRSATKAAISSAFHSWCP